MDGAVFSNNKEVGLGVVIRDHVGNFITGLSKKFWYSLGGIEVEEKSFESGLVFAKDMEGTLLLSFKLFMKIHMLLLRLLH